MATIVLFRLGQAQGARAFLQTWRGLVPDVTAPEPAGPTLQFMFGWSGLERLLAGHSTLDPALGRKELGIFFTDPTEAPDAPGVRASLGFAGDSDPLHWWNGDGAITSRAIDMAVHAAFDNPGQQDALLRRLRASASECGLLELKLDAFPDGAMSGYRPPGGRLHFGYRDGITAPDIDWSSSGESGKADLREFVLGYPNDAYPTKPLDPGPWRDFARDGSYVGLTWIRQDAPAFNRFLAGAEPVVRGYAPVGREREWLAAKMMGRWRDGSPVALHPDVPPATADLTDAFGYADDPNGRHCPLTAHVRVAFSRDQPMRSANVSRFPNGPPRLIRRGFSYGPRLDPEDRLDDDGRDRGIIGLFFFARINEQFYTIMRWMHETSFSDLFGAAAMGKGQDAVLGTRVGPKVDPSFRPGGTEINLHLSPFIRYRGVAVLFAPSLSSLDILGGRAQRPT